VVAAAGSTIHLTPATTDKDTATGWFSQFEGAGLDGLIAKPASGIYEPDKRVMKKIKHERTADCVVAGYRTHKSGEDVIGSLLLGLYTDDGKLASVGVGGALPMERRRELFRGLQPPASAPRAGPRPAGGTRTRTCRSYRCGPNACSRSATTTWRDRASGTPPSS